MRIASVHELGSATVRRYSAPQPVFTCPKKLFYIERLPGVSGPEKQRCMGRRPRAILKPPLAMEEYARVEHGNCLALDLRTRADFTANLQVFCR
jgi:hypothetical protein